MPRTCRCCWRSTTSRFAVYCPAHQSRNRRHGHPEQLAITKDVLKPKLRTIRRRIAKNSVSPLWDCLEARWGVILEHSKGVLASKAPMDRHYRTAARELAKLGTSVEADTIVETALAMVVLQSFEPQRFKSDKAFRVQLSRRLRGLTDLNAGLWYDHTTGKMKRAYRELSPKAAVIIAGIITQAFGPAGLRIAQLERMDHEERNYGVSTVRRALEALD
ncbi:hypothetical protein KIO73_18020 [Chelatococcus asaccharovorans]|nr:hypothetical protein [Chelatococcus asaccharovorans]